MRLFSYRIIWKKTGRAEARSWRTHPSSRSGRSSPSTARRKWHWISECTRPTNTARSSWHCIVPSGCWTKPAWCYLTEYVYGDCIHCAKDFGNFAGKLQLKYYIISLCLRSYATFFLKFLILNGIFQRVYIMSLQDTKISRILVKFFIDTQFLYHTC